MSTAITERPLTYEEERGKPMPSRNHAAVQSNLILEFSKDRKYRILSELTLEIDGDRPTPDLCAFLRVPLDFRRDAVREKEPPLMAVEIFSPQQGTQPVLDKVDLYFRHGVKSVWIVSPPLHTIQILTADGGEQTLSSGVATDPVTGLSANLDVVFS